MSRHGEAWIESPRRRTVEKALIAPLMPAARSIAAAGVVVPVIHEVPRSSYPGDHFLLKKFGDPEKDTALLRIFRKAMVDELPQILDIWEGSMALIGPRADEPEHIDGLFDAIGDPDLRDRWQAARELQRPGIISSYAVHSHRHNLDALPESSRFSEEEARAANAHLRARLDIADLENASFNHDMRLIAATASMAVANYIHYAQGLVSAPAPVSET
ncbi:MAG TPA: sugar transferase [Candidatus Saccharimonadales bacterium]|jgi:hypothetical protein|nr:sugar transferase [Candidatus Saccharimonadales bacterium]